MMERFETMDSKEKNIEGLKMEYSDFFDAL